MIHSERELAPLPVEARYPDEPKIDIVGAAEHLAGLRVLFLGIPGAGKTTLAEQLQEMGAPVNYISLGDISRNLDPESPESQELDRLFEAGAPVGPADFFLKLIEPHVNAANETGQGFILDGIPKKAEEIDPLLKWLAEKDAPIDLVVSCELPALTAYDRIAQRPERAGDRDTMEIFTNRVHRYLADLALFKTGLTHGSEVPLLVIDTANSNPRAAAHALLRYTSLLQESGPTRMKDEHERILADHLFELVGSEDKVGLTRLYGKYFDDYIPSIDHARLTDPESQPDEVLAIVEESLATEDPSLRRAPKFLRRFAENYVKTTVMSFDHLATSLVEEVVARYGEEYTADNLLEVFNQQRELKELMEAMQEEVIGGRDLFEVLEQELQVNGPELKHIQKVLLERAEVLGLDPSVADVRMLMGLQAALWGQFTSNQILLAPDVNYRRTVNGQPGSHHSLLPFTRNSRAFVANSMGEYVPFIEAVSATEFNGYSSTFGFVHFMGMGRDGEAYGAEYPILMHDQRLLSLDSEGINKTLRLIEGLYGNHDLWHNLIPVYADHFILHHPHAPISYGGRLPAYVQFGRDLRFHKEEYEIGVAMAHARTQQERFSESPSLRKQQEGYILEALETVGTLRDELSGKCAPSEIERIVDYLACRAATKAFNVFPPTDPIHAEIDRRMDALGLPALLITAPQVATLLWKQRLINVDAVETVLGSRGISLDTILDAMQDTNVAREILASAVDLARTDRETGAEHIGNALKDWRALEALVNNGVLHLRGTQKARWLAIMGPQREQLRGHMEKVHGKSGYKMSSQEVSEPRDLVLMQYGSIVADKEHYSYRLAARAENQKLSYLIYSMIFDDNQELASEARTMLGALSRGDHGTELQDVAQQVVMSFDNLMDELVSANYRDVERDLRILENFMANLETVSVAPEVGAKIEEIVRRYRALQQKERAYQVSLGKTYAQATQQLIDEQMSIS